jgi:EAL and modified HD-GYP domain-containing signal transduction protein
MEIYLARQPIFKADKKIYGYELLFRDGMSNVFPDIDGEIATSKLLNNSLLSIGIDKITGNKKAFINFTQDLLIRRIPLLLPKEQVVVEVLEDVEPVPEVIEACRDISRKGFHIALDDFFYRSELTPLIELSSAIKFDFRLTPIDELAGDVKKLTKYDVTLLAEKIETYEEFQEALDMGFTLFQGYFFSRPEIVSGRDIPAPQLNLLQVMAEANREDVAFGKLEEAILRDVSISYKLLRYINSAYFRRVIEISSIKHAVTLLGEKEIRRFLSLVAMAGLAGGKPNELIRISIIRAKFCEILAEEGVIRANSSEAFTLGLFSLIDAIMDDSMETLMEKLSLSDKIRQALISRTGDLRDFLDLVVSYEKGDWIAFARLANHIGAAEEEMPRCFMAALEWANSFPTT